MAELCLNKVTIFYWRIIMLCKKNWYGIYTHANTEKKLYENINNRKIEAFLPLTKEIRQWSDRKKEFMLPVFKSYVFVYVDFVGMHIIKKLAGFSHYIRFGGYPTIISEHDINLIRTVIQHYSKINAISSNFISGEKVKIYRGILSGYSGVLTKDQQGKKVALAVNKLNQSLLVEIPETDIIRI